MDLSTKVLGTSIVTKLQQTIAAPILTIGTDQFTRADLAGSQCFNFLATYHLNKALAEFRVKNTRDLFMRIAPTALALPQIGAIALAVLGTAFALKDLGGDSPLESWVARHSDKGAEGIRTFHTIKHKVLAEERGEKKAAKARKKQRTEKARAIKTERFLARTEAANGKEPR